MKIDTLCLMMFTEYLTNHVLDHHSRQLVSCTSSLQETLSMDARSLIPQLWCQPFKGLHLNRLLTSTRMSCGKIFHTRTKEISDLPLWTKHWLTAEHQSSCSLSEIANTLILFTLPRRWKKWRRKTDTLRYQQSQFKILNNH